eukprot:s20_g15.t1
MHACGQALMGWNPRSLTKKKRYHKMSWPLAWLWCLLAVAAANCSEDLLCEVEDLEVRLLQTKTQLLQPPAQDTTAATRVTETPAPTQPPPATEAPAVATTQPAAAPAAVATTQPAAAPAAVATTQPAAAPAAVATTQPATAPAAVATTQPPAAVPASATTQPAAAVPAVATTQPVAAAPATEAPATTTQPPAPTEAAPVATQPPPPATEAPPVVTTQPPPPQAPSQPPPVEHPAPPAPIHLPPPPACRGDGRFDQNDACKFNPSWSGCVHSPGCNWNGQSYFGGWCEDLVSEFGEIGCVQNLKNPVGYGFHGPPLPGQAAAIEMLVYDGEDVNEKDSEGRTPLWQAVSHQQLLATEKLLELGATDLDQEWMKKTLLGVACYEGYPMAKLVETLLEHKADVNKADGYGKTPLSYASRPGLAFLRALGQEATCGQCDLALASVPVTEDFSPWRGTKDRDAIGGPRCVYLPSQAICLGVNAGCYWQPATAPLNWAEGDAEAAHAAQVAAAAWSAAASAAQAARENSNCFGDGSLSQNLGCPYHVLWGTCVVTAGCNWHGESALGGWCTGGTQCTYQPVPTSCMVTPGCRWQPATAPLMVPM